MKRTATWGSNRTALFAVAWGDHISLSHILGLWLVSSENFIPYYDDRRLVCYCIAR